MFLFNACELSMYIADNAIPRNGESSTSAQYIFSRPTTINQCNKEVHPSHLSKKCNKEVSPCTLPTMAIHLNALYSSQLGGKR